MIVSVSLIRDSVENFERFLGLNLAGGIDHMIVFLDGDQPDLARVAEKSGRVTVRTVDPGWWGQSRLASLNSRQRVVANLARTACARVGFVDWLFFIDGDEVALLDRDVIGDLDAGIRGIRLSPLESVSSRRAAAHGYFKPLLAKPALRRLRRRGLVEKANNAAFFHGHVSGKVGIRPSDDVRFWVHTAVDEQGSKLSFYEHPDLRHLHFESPTVGEFERKWRNLAMSGPSPGMRSNRREILSYFQHPEQDADAHARAVARLYDRYVADDLDALLAAGVVQRVDLQPARLAAGRRLGAGQLELLEEQLAVASSVDKALFLPHVPTGELSASLEAPAPAPAAER